MSDNRNFIIGVLSITATVLFVGLLIVGSTANQQALAIGQTDRGGDYIMVTGQFTENSELVYVVDAAAKRLNSYSYEATTRDFVLWYTVELDRITAGAGQKR